ncbi:amino acid permease [Ruminiclostridium herbifermentans]|uniref:Amino acid permease n=1 Tax=Ruminiclostridium herbifermentans TaxID=2488810 RepID=A0A4U7JGQ0_9FIRM|nr:amino acid permease [Ruminiclostridium herbifermentans]QNU67090.1 amino acid permease [Ruminiclostridium herbifermentans]
MDKTKNNGLSEWQLTMMALGTVIGGSFFVGSSIAINAAGPSILISYIIGGILVYFILTALSEMTVANPDAGSFRTFTAQAFGRGAGFIVGWVYWTGMVIAMSSEAAAVSILIREWIPNVSIMLLGSVIIISVTLLNLLGADKLSKLESGLAVIKLLAIASFVILGLLLIIGLVPGIAQVGLGELAKEEFMPGGIKGIAGSMLIVMFAYAGFEVIGFAASECDNAKENVPKAIKYTVICLVGFYLVSVIVMLPLVATSELNENVSPMVTALNRWGIGWAGTGINFVMVTAILSTMLAAMFGLGRMIRSLADESLAPKWLIDKQEVPKRGILFSGFSMLLGLGFGMLAPKVYMFLTSSGGFALLFTYAVIMAAHIRLRKINGCPDGICQLKGYPYSSWIVLLSLIVIIFSMPFINGQASGLFAGLAMTFVYFLVYIAIKAFSAFPKNRLSINSLYKSVFLTEFSKEISPSDHKKETDDEEFKD